ncbi:lysophospholipid acyltransferase family protein [Kozakia baliensis]|uniref:lysophospholipid acyltransferase family protein n=1 Tax=Kozakia baliensis TaxID=153496 RepID=UPI00345BFAEA
MIQLRAVLFAVYFFFLTLLMGIGAFPIRWLKKRGLALHYAQLWAKLTLAGLTRICRIEIDISGLENIPAGPCLIASQHQSYFDGFVWMNLSQRPAYIIKQELTRIPLVGPMLLLAGMVPVERAAGAKALRDMMRRAQESFAENRQIIIFPEGTRTLPGERVPLQPGIVALAKQSDVPIVPVATNSGAHWPRQGFLKYPGRIVIAIGKPIPTQAGRGALIGAITQAWEGLSHANNLPVPVDNSVGGTR